MSPAALLANIYLHTVLDEWFVRDVQPALTRKAEMVRFADDLVVLFENEQDAERFLAALPKRFGRYQLHRFTTLLVIDDIDPRVLVGDELIDVDYLQ